ncbi:hypothetical protein [Thalassotalea sp. PLHSN55]
MSNSQLFALYFCLAPTVIFFIVAAALQYGQSGVSLFKQNIKHLSQAGEK